jgi:serine/threonine protein kinase
MPRLLFRDIQIFLELEKVISVHSRNLDVKGTFGLVFQAIDRQTKKKVAIKKFKATKEGEGISLTAYREIMVLHHPIRI